MQRVEFTIPNDPRAMRNVNGGAVESLDAALAASMGGAQVMHGMDPRRILTLAAGGPPVWSVAVASREGIHQFLTYGLSRAVDPASPFAFELALRVRDDASPSPMWPMMFNASIEDAAMREGSDCQAFCVPGLRWSDDGSAFAIEIPAASAGKLKRRLLSRLPFGQGLLVHGEEPGPGSEILFMPAEQIGVPDTDAQRLTLELPHASAYVSLLADDQSANWTLRY